MKRWHWIILALILCSSGAMAKTIERILAQVNNDIITLSEFNREMRNVRLQLSAKYKGDQLEQEVKKAEKETLDILIREKLLLQKAVELGGGSNIDVRVSSEIQRQIKEYKLKDMDELEKALDQQGMTLKEYRERIRKDIITNDMIEEFVVSRIAVLSEEVEQYYKDHAADFTIPEEVSLSEIEISGNASAIELETRANDIYQRLKQGESFSTLVSQYSKGPTAGKGGSIGSYVLSKLNPDIIKAIEGLNEGDISAPQKYKEGYMIYRVDTRKPASVQPLEKVKNYINDRIFQRKFAPEYNRYMTLLKEEAYIQIFAETK
jgi:peptidyl-prolyl cis-trans isomerase SurA